MTENTNDEIQCHCGARDIEHSHDGKWKCQDCGRFYDAKSLDRLAGYVP